MRRPWPAGKEGGEKRHPADSEKRQVGARLGGASWAVLRVLPFSNCAGRCGQKLSPVLLGVKVGWGRGVHRYILPGGVTRQEIETLGMCMPFDSAILPLGIPPAGV